MDRYFDQANGPLMRAFDQVYKWLVLNLLFVLFTLLGGVVFGLFPSLFTLFRVTKRIRQDQEEGLSLFVTYKDTFQSLFWKGNQLGLFLVLIGTITVFDGIFLYQNHLIVDELTLFGIVLSMGGLLLGFLVAGLFLFVGLIVGFYERFGTWDTIRFALLSTLSSPWLLLQLLLVTGGSYLVFSVLISAAPFLGVSLPVWLLVWRYQTTYRKMFTIRSMGAIRLSHIRYKLDLPSYLRVLEDIVPAEVGLVDIDAVERLLRRDALDAERSAILIDHTDRLIGFLVVHTVEAGHTIAALAVDKAHQRQGYGTVMLEHLLTTATNDVFCDTDGRDIHPALSHSGSLAAFLTHHQFTHRTDTTYQRTR